MTTPAFPQKRVQPLVQNLTLTAVFLPFGFAWFGNVPKLDCWQGRPNFLAGIAESVDEGPRSLKLFAGSYSKRATDAGQKC
jgi:hypothetical protein